MTSVQICNTTLEVEKEIDKVCEVNDKDSFLWSSISEVEDVRQTLKNVALCCAFGKI